MPNISVTKARENLPKIAEEVYFRGKTFTITKRGIPMAKMIKADKTTTKTKRPKKNIENALKLARSIRWIWDDEWKDKTTKEIAELLAERAWSSHAS